MSLPDSLKQLRNFLGLINCYCHFSPNCAEKTPLLLTELLKNQRKKDAPITLSPTAIQAFESVKTDFTQTSYLAHPVADAKLFLIVDASNSVIGTILQQSVNGRT